MISEEDFIAYKPASGLVYSVSGSPGPAEDMVIAISILTPTGQSIITTRAKFSNAVPDDVDIRVVVNTPVTIGWLGDEPLFSIPYDYVRTDCTDQPQP